MDSPENSLDNEKPARRETTYGMSRAELAIYEAMRIVQELGYNSNRRMDERLVEALLLLDKARERVADYIDRVK